MTALLNLAGELARRHDVHVFAKDGPSGRGQYVREGARVNQLDGSPDLLEHPSRGRRLVRLASFASRLREGVGQVHATGAFDVLHGFWAFDPGLLAALMGRGLRVPVVLSVGGGEAVWLPDIGYGGARSWSGRARVRFALSLANAITAGSAFAARQLPDRTAARARVVPLGIRCETFAASPVRSPGPPWRLLQVADLNLVKDQETLLQAVRRIVDRLGDVSLDCIGEDTLGGRLQRRAAELGLAQHVRFHGFLPQRALPDFYQRAHLHVVSSRYESQGVAILEAAAAGLPTVGTAVGLLPSMAPAAARCVAVGDSAALADQACALLADKIGREGVGAAAQRWAQAHDAVWTAREFESIYAEVIR